MLYKEATKRSRRKTVRGRPAGLSRPDSWDVNITFNLRQPQSGSLVANAKFKGLDVTLDDPADFADGS